MLKLKWFTRRQKSESGNLQRQNPLGPDLDIFRETDAAFMALCGLAVEARIINKNLVAKLSDRILDDWNAVTIRIQQLQAFLLEKAVVSISKNEILHRLFMAEWLRAPVIGTEKPDLSSCYLVALKEVCKTKGNTGAEQYGCDSDPPSRGATRRCLKELVKELAPDINLTVVRIVELIDERKYGSPISEA